MVEKNRDLIWVALVGILIIIFLQVMAHHGPDAEETIRAIKCAERARARTEGGECVICLVDCSQDAGLGQGDQ